MSAALASVPAALSSSSLTSSVWSSSLITIPVVCCLEAYHSFWSPGSSQQDQAPTQTLSAASVLQAAGFMLARLAVLELTSLAALLIVSRVTRRQPTPDRQACATSREQQPCTCAGNSATYQHQAGASLPPGCWAWGTMLGTKLGSVAVAACVSYLVWVASQ
jgi:hypothetical protein